MLADQLVQQRPPSTRGTLGGGHEAVGDEGVVELVGVPGVRPDLRACPRDRGGVRSRPGLGAPRGGAAGDAKRAPFLLGAIVKERIGAGVDHFLGKGRGGAEVPRGSGDLAVFEPGE